MTLKAFPKTWRMPAEQRAKLLHLTEWLAAAPHDLVLPDRYHEAVNDAIGNLGPVDLENVLVECRAHAGGYKVVGGTLLLELYLDSSDGSTPDHVLELLPI